jgi:hypothetical protein
MTPLHTKFNRNQQFNYIPHQDINPFFDFHGSNISQSQESTHVLHEI